MTTVLLALVLAAQNPLPPAPPPNQTPPPREPSAAHAIIDQEADTAQARAEAREVLNAFGRCVARASAAMAEETLVMDFTSRAYRSRLRQMADNNRESCFRRAGRMRMDGLLLVDGIFTTPALLDAEVGHDGNPREQLAELARLSAVPLYASVSSVDPDDMYTDGRELAPGEVANGLALLGQDPQEADTFFQALPTPRPYARFPFYNLSNTTEVFATVASVVLSLMWTVTMSPT